jgi:hypothetical protein
MLLVIGLSCIDFIMLRYLPAVPSSFLTFITKRFWILSKEFFSSIKMSVWFLSLLLFLCCIIFANLSTLNHPCITGLKWAWSWCTIFFDI